MRLAAGPLHTRHLCGCRAVIEIRHSTAPAAKEQLIALAQRRLCDSCRDTVYGRVEREIGEAMALQPED